jgi:hypothetical protein
MAEVYSACLKREKKIQILKLTFQKHVLTITGSGFYAILHSYIEFRGYTMLVNNCKVIKNVVKCNNSLLTFGSSRKNCSDFVTTGVFRQILHRGEISSVALTRCPQPSH